MTDDGFITNKILLDHIQGNTAAVDRLSKRVDGISQRLDCLEITVKEGFEEARQDRQNLHDDLDATIRMQATHEQKIAVLTGGPMPEDY